MTEEETQAFLKGESSTPPLAPTRPAPPSTPTDGPSRSNSQEEGAGDSSPAKERRKLGRELGGRSNTLSASPSSKVPMRGGIKRRSARNTVSTLFKSMKKSIKGQKEQLSFENDAYFFEEETNQGPSQAMIEGTPLYWDQLPADAQQDYLEKMDELDRQEEAKQNRRSSNSSVLDLGGPGSRASMISTASFSLTPDVAEDEEDDDVDGIRAWRRFDSSLFSRDTQKGLSINDMLARLEQAEAQAQSTPNKRKLFSFKRKKSSKSANAQDVAPVARTNAERNASDMLMTTEQRIAIMSMVRDGGMSVDDAMKLVEKQETTLEAQGATRKDEVKLGASFSASDPMDVVLSMNTELDDSAKEDLMQRVRSGTVSVADAMNSVLDGRPVDDAATAAKGTDKGGAGSEPKSADSEPAVPASPAISFEDADDEKEEFDNLADGSNTLVTVDEEGEGHEFEQSTSFSGDEGSSPTPNADGGAESPAAPAEPAANSEAKADSTESGGDAEAPTPAGDGTQAEATIATDAPAEPAAETAETAEPAAKGDVTAAVPAEFFAGVVSAGANGADVLPASPPTPGAPAQPDPKATAPAEFLAATAAPPTPEAPAEFLAATAPTAAQEAPAEFLAATAAPPDGTATTPEKKSDLKEMLQARKDAKAKAKLEAKAKLLALQQKLKGAGSKAGTPTPPTDTPPGAPATESEATASTASPLAPPPTIVATTATGAGAGAAASATSADDTPPNGVPATTAVAAPVAAKPVADAPAKPTPPATQPKKIPPKRPPPATVKRPAPAVATKKAAPVVAAKKATLQTMLGLSAEDCQAYRTFWSLATKSNGAITGSIGIILFKRSGLPQDILKKAWSLADKAKPHGQLNENEFYVALKLIALAQQDLGCELVNISKTGLQLPTLDIDP